MRDLTPPRRFTPDPFPVGLLAALSLAVAAGCGGGGDDATPVEVVRTVRTAQSIRIEHSLPPEPTDFRPTDPDATPYAPRSARSVRLMLVPLTEGGGLVGSATSVAPSRRAEITGRYAPGRYRLTVTLHPEDRGAGVPVASGEQVLEIGAAPDAPETVPLPEIRSTVRTIRFVKNSDPIFRYDYPGAPTDPLTVPALPEPYRLTASEERSSLFVPSVRAVACDAQGRVVPMEDADWRWSSSDPDAVLISIPVGRATGLYAPRGPAAAEIIAVNTASGVRARLPVVVTTAAPTPSPFAPPPDDGPGRTGTRLRIEYPARPEPPEPPSGNIGGNLGRPPMRPSVRLRLTPLDPGGSAADSVGGGQTPPRIVGEFPRGRYRLTVTRYPKPRGEGTPVAVGERVLEVGAGPESDAPVALPILRSTVRRVAFRARQTLASEAINPPPGTPLTFAFVPPRSPYAGADGPFLGVVAYDAEGREVDGDYTDWRWSSSDPAAVAVGFLGPVGGTPVYAPRGPVTAEITAVEASSGVRNTIRVDVAAPAP